MIIVKFFNKSNRLLRIKFFDDTLYSQQPATFVKEFNDDDVAQIFMETLEKNMCALDVLILSIPINH